MRHAALVIVVAASCRAHVTRVAAPHVAPAAWATGLDGVKLVMDADVTAGGDILALGLREHDSVVARFDPSGRMGWTATVPRANAKAIRTTPDGGVVVIAPDRTTKLDSDGAEQWSAAIEGVHVVPDGSGGALIATGSELLALDDTGATRWRTDLIARPVALASARGEAILVLSSGDMVAFGLGRGDRRWEARLDVRTGELDTILRTETDDTVVFGAWRGDAHYELRDVGPGGSLGAPRTIRVDRAETGDIEEISGSTIVAQVERIDEGSDIVLISSGSARITIALRATSSLPRPGRSLLGPAYVGVAGMVLRPHRLVMTGQFSGDATLGDLRLSAPARETRGFIASIPLP